MRSEEITVALKAEFKRRVQDESLVRICNCLERLDDQQIWWRPNEESNSVGNLVLHLCGNIRQYIHTGIGRLDDLRERNEEFSSRGGYTRHELKQMITRVVEEAVGIVQDVRSEVLTEIRPVQVFEESVLSMIVHVIEHSSYHTGQIAWITKSRLNAPLGFYSDFDL